jgi:hypothetical protein
MIIRRKKVSSFLFLTFLGRVYANNSVQKVSSPAIKIKTITITIRMEETKQYSDVYSQYKASELVASSSSQTDLQPVIRQA